METMRLPEFTAAPLIEVPTVIPRANFLTGDFGKAVLDEFKERAEADHDNADVLNVLLYSNNIVKGSNPFAVVLVNQIVSQAGLRTATPADLERVLQCNALPLRGQYEDSALILRSDGNPNEYLAGDLIKQVQARNPKAKMPLMIPLAGLELANDSNSRYGLAFKLKEDAEVIYAPQLAGKNDGKRFSQTDRNGLPILDEEGNRIFYLWNNSGLSRLYLGRNLDLNGNYYDDDLGSSNDGGRVVCVSDEVGAKK